MTVVPQAKVFAAEDEDQLMEEDDAEQKDNEVHDIIVVLSEIPIPNTLLLQHVADLKTRILDYKKAAMATKTSGNLSAARQYMQNIHTLFCNK